MGASEVKPVIEVQPQRNDLDYLLHGPLINVPDVIMPHGDELGLVTHTRLMEEVTLGVFARLDYAAASIIKANPDVRAAFLASDSVQLGDLAVSKFHAYSVYRAESEDGVAYDVIRTDRGSDGGGFIFVHKNDGAVLFRLHQLETFDEKSPEYRRALSQALRFIEILTREFNIPTIKARALDQKLFTTAEFRERMVKQHTKERSFSYRATEKAKAVGRKVGRTVTRVVTVPDTNDELLPGSRKFSPARVALIAALLPIPGYSGDVSEQIPIPRPATIELANDVLQYSVFADEHAAEEAQSVLAAYDAQRFDLPTSADIEVTGLPQDVPITPNIGSGIIQSAPEITVANPSVSVVELEGASPRQLKLQGVLSGGDCLDIPVSPEDPFEGFGFTALTASDAEDLSVEASHQGIKVCNTQPTSIKLTGRSFYFDNKS